MNRRYYRGTSPMPTDKYDNIRQNMRDNDKYIVLHPQVPGEPVQRGFFHNPYVRALGLVGIGAALGAAGYHYRQPFLKLGQKFLNYSVDKFHHLFNPVNETNSTQSQNRFVN